MSDRAVFPTALETATLVSIGLLAGALLIESAVLVPYWRSLDSREFGKHHHGFAGRLFRFFAPLTTIAVALAFVSGLREIWAGLPEAAGDWLTLGGSTLAVSLLAFYGLYFQSANLRLPELARAGSDTELAAALREWPKVHRVRTVVSLAALALMALGCSY